MSAVLGRLLLNFLKSGLAATPLTRALSCPHEQIEQLWRHGGAADGRPGSIAGAVVGQGELQEWGRRWAWSQQPASSSSSSDDE